MQDQVDIRLSVVGFLLIFFYYLLEKLTRATCRLQCSALLEEKAKLNGELELQRRRIGQVESEAASASKSAKESKEASDAGSVSTMPK